MANKNKWWMLVLGITLSMTQFCFGKKFNPKYQMKNYTILDDGSLLNNGLRFVVLADYNGGDLLNHPKSLLKDIVKTQPDAIFIVGNFFSKRGNDKNCVELINHLSDFYPIYMVPGENEYAVTGYENLFSDLKRAGVEILKNDVALLEVGTQKVEIFGLDETTFYTDADEWAYYIHEKMRSQEPNDSNAYRVVLAHQTFPQFFYKVLNCHLVVTANSQGGYIKVPFTHGLYAPKQGFFPRKTSGVYTIGKEKTKRGFVSKGLKTSYFIPRYCNRPELSILNIKRCQEK